MSEFSAPSRPTDPAGIVRKPVEKNEDPKMGIVITGASLRSWLTLGNLVMLIGGFIWIVRTYDRIENTMARLNEEIFKLKQSSERIEGKQESQNNKLIRIETIMEKEEAKKKP